MESPKEEDGFTKSCTTVRVIKSSKLRFTLKIPFLLTDKHMLPIHLPDIVINYTLLQDRQQSPTSFKRW